MKKGKNQFMISEIEKLYELVEQKNDASPNAQKSIRSKIRKIGFYYSDFSDKKNNYTIQDIQALIKSGAIKIFGQGQKANQESTLAKTLTNKASASNHIKQSFECLYNDGANTLILGTLPGDKSLQSFEYYANSRNSFWQILRICYEENTDFVTYKDKLDFLKKYKIALWDVYRESEREGSLDANIKSESVNDINQFLKEHPSIQKIIFNGKKANKTYQQHFEQLKDIEYHTLPSTSSAHTIMFEQKVEAWRMVLASNHLSK